VVHLIRYRAADLEQLPQRINAAGFGLTFGIHSRIQASIDLMARELAVGNVYVNRNMIGAVVGVQPFGGQGLSGTGPKAGGPLYLGRLLRAVAAQPPAHRPLPDEAAGDLPQAFDCRAVLHALAELQQEWRHSDLHARLAPARALHERIAHDPFRDHDARAALAAQLHQLIQQAEAIGQPRVLPGPTGESNTLHFRARGVLLCGCREGAGESDVLLPALAALLAGNAVLFLSDAATGAPVLAVRNLLADAGFADGLCAHHALPDIADMQAVIAACATDGVLCHGDPALAQRLSRTLVARAGALLPLIDDDFGPHYLERFVHETTISVNTAASGGNAALLSQAESD